MPTNLTDSSTWTTPVAVPTDGDPVAAGSGSNIRTTFQTFANRTKYLYDILTSTGITKIRKVTSTASLKGLTSPVEGDVAILATGGTPQIFLYRSTALVGSDLTNLRYDSTTATGYWISPWFYIASVSGGIRLDVQTLPPPNRVVSIDESGETSGSTTPTALGGVFGPTLSVTVETGDLVLLEGHCTFAPNGADADGYVSIAVDGTPQALANRKWDCANSGSSPLTPSVLYTAAADGTLTIRLYQIRENFASGTPSLTANRSLRATVYRPLSGHGQQNRPGTVPLFCSPQSRTHQQAQISTCDPITNLRHRVIQSPDATAVQLTRWVIWIQISISIPLPSQMKNSTPIGKRRLDIWLIEAKMFKTCLRKLELSSTRGANAGRCSTTSRLDRRSCFAR